MKKFALKFLSITLVILISATSCKKQDDVIPDPGTNPNGLTFQEVINSSGNFDTPVESESSEITNTTTEVIGNTEWSCTTETVNANAASGGNSGFPLFSPNAGVIYPGSMLQGNSLNSGNPNPIVIERAGGTISTDVLDGNIQSTFEVDQISKSEVTNAINNIIAGSSGIVPANFSIKIQNIQSREQFALALGVDVNSTFVDLESNLNYSSDINKSTFMVSMTQSYYTMSFDLPTSLDKLFAPSVTPQDLANYVSENNPATYISDVTYGRVFYMLIESTSSQQELEVAVKGAFNGLTTTVDTELDINYFNSLDEVTYSVFAYGGASAATLKAVGVTDISTLVDILAESSSIGSGKPLSYVVRSVADDKIVATQLATTYDVVNCEISGASGALPIVEHWTGNVLSAMGPVGAAYCQSYGSDQFILINKDGDQYMRSTSGNLTGPFPINDLLGNVPFQIGAACMDYKSTNADRLIAFDLNGTKFSVFDNGGWGAVKSITNYAGGTSPFNLTGIGAMGYAAPVDIDQNFFDGLDPGGDNNYQFNQAGNKYAHWYTHLGPVLSENYTPVFNLYDWGIDGSITAKIPDVGASIGFKQGNDHFFIHFNKAGTKYIVYGNVNGDNSNEVIGPFDL